MDQTQVEEEVLLADSWEAMSELFGGY